MAQEATLQIKIDSDLKEQHLTTKEKKRTLGLANGKYAIPDDIDECNFEIAEMFGVEG